MLLPSGSRTLNMRRNAGLVHHAVLNDDAVDRFQTRVFGLKVGSLDADRAATGLVAHGRIERQSGGGARRRDLKPPSFAIRAEALVRAHLVAELVRVERESRVLVGDREHRHAEVRDRRGGVRISAHGAKTAAPQRTHRCPTQVTRRRRPEATSTKDPFVEEHPLQPRATKRVSRRVGVREERSACRRGRSGARNSGLNPRRARDPPSAETESSHSRRRHRTHAHRRGAARHRPTLGRFGGRTHRGCTTST